MPIGNLGHNPNVSASIPLAPPLPSQTDGARGSQGQPISSSGALGSRLLFTPIRQSVADGVDARSSDVPGLPVNPLRIAASEITLNDGFEVLHDRGALDTLNKAIGSSSFRVETQDDGSHVAIGQKDGVETSVILSEQEFASLQAIDPEGNGRFVFTGARGGAGHSMVTAASDITEARQRIIDKLEPKDSRTSNSGGVNSAETQTSSTSSSSSTSTLRSDPKLWLSLGSIAAGLIGMAATGIAQAVALTPEPDDPTSTDPDAAASTAEAATKDQLTKEAFQNPDNQKVNIDGNGNAIPSGELKDDVVEQIAEQAKAAGEQARQEAIESNSQAQKRYDEQHARRQEELSTSSGAGYGLSGALILGGGIGLGVTTLLHRRNQPVEQTSTTTTTTTATHTTAGNKPADNTPASGNTESSGAEEPTASRRNSEIGSTASASPSDTSSIDTVDNPYADVGRTSRQELPEEHIYDQVAADEPIYANIQRSAGDAPDGRVRLMGNLGAGIQSVYALLSQGGGLQHGLGGLTGSGDSSAANNSNNPPVPGSNRFV
ncbi:type III secretion system LEE translocated intimin receptor Tir [Escherichia albertii]|uniref:type III secretion system LEE translocated intimin receptor Tir n=1 Tax=Escherichia albertii TaxID=208962 RepID=UPI000F617169|nr:type III secretion system LEE translocated intimin receptor Tir [Escherichia albertii]EFZ2302317.1 type III secretion system LEE translocated intimin receptor Tir [Shigella boydii]EFG1228408.1 type III secretion system LEE translocated intimin receptor Tir [Escherichia albertii]EFZ6210723.1 type III secretion system LEE translocated intimin receptor Tir [Shigella boydii]EFZ6323360.1 type III secretion system LEE translocated intimin receptor Tir [Shigella boydii]EFZ8837118.1 type III secret